MKTTLKLFLAASLATRTLNAAEEAATNAPAVPPSPVAQVSQPVVPSPDVVTTNVDVVTNTAMTNASGGLLLNFRDAQLETVLDYLSEAAGFIIIREATMRGKVNVVSKQPMSKEEALDVLDSELHKNGLAAIRSGRKLTIVNRDEAKTKGIPVKSGSNPDTIPLNDEIVTQIMPVRYVEVTQLIKDLQPLVSSQTTMTANEAGNSIVITDTQANIHRVAEIIKAIDSGAEDVTDVRVFKLQYADPTEMANLLTSAFPDETRSATGGNQSPFQFGGRGGGPGGLGRFFGGGGGADTGGSNTQSQRMKKRTKVTAVPDPRTASVIVTATSGLMDQIAKMIEQLDSNPAKKQKVYVFSLENADPQQVQQVLAEMFETSNTRNNSRSSQQNNALQNRANQSQTSGNSSGFGTGGTGGRAGGNRSGGF
ncbi:MAG: hypothetical protein HOP33_03950 [Verrucomicrobia bacterium]|nr:hypothetical protein [Verrucomicrobiota bacterium]